VESNIQQRILPARGGTDWREEEDDGSSGGIYLNLQRLSGLQHLHLARLQVSVNRIDAWLTSIFTTINQQAVVATSRG